MITNIKQLKSIIERSEQELFNSISKIGKVNKTINIEIDLKHSKHSLERQGRSSTYIKNSDIKIAVEKATEQIVSKLIDNTINVGDPIWIFDTSNNLNIVGSLLANKYNDDVTFRVITVMVSDNFYNKNKTYKITV
jgi:hypothetical protein